MCTSQLIQPAGCSVFEYCTVDTEYQASLILRLYGRPMSSNTQSLNQIVLLSGKVLPIQITLAPTERDIHDTKKRRKKKKR